MVERHRGAKSKLVLITKSSKEQDGYEGAQGGDSDGSEKTSPAPVPDPILASGTPLSRRKTT
ncbi:protein of unknown function [Bradyrhizobium vignae]|uniref:Uncharacterized protein n=1 Tax=Bradyrhizobium vignae TaxID=1549949 RepID=A0A2U3PWP5_9BRAD|nr:protein of unknown function [Bradyrhizobium vignae]